MLDAAHLARLVPPLDVRGAGAEEAAEEGRAPLSPRLENTDKKNGQGCAAKLTPPCWNTDKQNGQGRNANKPPLLEHPEPRLGSSLSPAPFFFLLSNVAFTPLQSVKLLQSHQCTC